MNTSTGVHSAEQCNSVILGIPPMADYAVNCSTSPHLSPPLKCVAACSTVAPLASLHVCTFQTSCFIKLELSVVCDKTVQFDTFYLHELSGTEYVRDDTAVPKHWLSAHFDIHGAYILCIAFELIIALRRDMLCRSKVDDGSKVCTL